MPKSELIDRVQVMTAPNEAVTTRAGKLPVVLIALITAIVFLPVLQNGFVNWDDKTVVNNPYYRGLGSADLRWMLGHFHFGRYQPLAWISLGLDYLLWWADPFGYHWTSLILHVINAIVFYFIAVRLLTLRTLGFAPSDETGLRMAAGLAALVFAIHPLRVEPVAWASARGDTLAGMFFLGSILCYLRAAAVDEDKRVSAYWRTASVFAYGLSLLSGTKGLALPIILLILDVYPLGRLRGEANWLTPNLRRLYWQKAPYILLALVALVITFAAKNADEAAIVIKGDSLIKWVLQLIAAPAFYLWKTILPVGLSPLYELPASSLLLGIVAVVAISAGSFMIRRQWPAVLASWICYLALIWFSPEGNPGSQQLLTDRNTYISCLPWALLIGGAAVHLRHPGMSGGSMRWPSFVGGGVTGLVLIGLGALTWAQTRIWQDSETLWRSAAAVSGSSQAHYNLAALFESQGKYDDAIASYRQVTEVDPQRWDAHEKAALLLQKQGKVREAVEHFRSVVQINPAATQARSNLAAGLVNQGEVAEAVEHFRKVLELAPDRNEARVKLATILATQGRLGDAEDLFLEAIKSDPSDARTLLRLGQVLAARGNLQSATQYFRQSLRIQPQDAEVHENLGRALIELGSRDEAAKHLREAVRILKSSPASQ